MMNKELNKYEVDEITDRIISEVDQEINEQFSGQQYQKYNPEQLSVLNLLRRAQQSPQGSSVFADLLRGAYSIPGTDDEIPPIPPEHLTIKDVYLQTMAFAVKASFLVTSPPAGVLTLARLMFDTPPPKTATALITTIAGIWGNAAKDIIDDTVIRAYRAVDHAINKVAIPLMTPFLTFFASGAMASAVDGRIGGSVLTVMENPNEVAKNTATTFNYPENVLLLKGQIKDDRIFIGLANDLIEYLMQYSKLYEQGLTIWKKAGVSITGEDFVQLLLSQWNDTIGSHDNQLRISSIDNMQKLLNHIRGKMPIDENLKESVVDFFSGVKFDENGGWTIVAGTVGSASIPLPLIRDQKPVAINNNNLTIFTPNSFFNEQLWISVFWKFWTEEMVSEAWSSSFIDNLELFFDNTDFLSTYISSGQTVFSTNPSLREKFLNYGRSYYIMQYGEGEYAQSLIGELEGVLNGSKIEIQNSKEEEEKNQGGDSNLSDMERRFVNGELTYEELTLPVKSRVPSRWYGVVGDYRLTSTIMDICESTVEKFKIPDDISLEPEKIKDLIYKFVIDSIIPQLTTYNIVSSTGAAFSLNLDGEQAEKYKEAILIGTNSNGVFFKEIYPAIGSFTTCLVIEKISKEININNSDLLGLLKNFES